MENQLEIEQNFAVEKEEIINPQLLSARLEVIEYVKE